MEVSEISDFIKVFNLLPSSWKVVFLVVFFLLPKLVNLVGGVDFIRNSASAVGMTIKDIVRNYQSRKQMQAEDKALTEAYTRTMVVESLSMFATRIDSIDKKLDLLIKKEED